MTMNTRYPGHFVQRLGRALSTPFEPEDYLVLFDPLRSARETRARVRRVRRESDAAVTLELTPGRRWQGHKAGQHVMLGVEIDGVRRQRCFSLSSAPHDRYLTVSVKASGKGGVSDHLVRHCREGDLLVLGDAAGDFVLPDAVPERLLMVTAGSGITPVHSIVKHLLASGFKGNLHWVHFEKTAADLMLARSVNELSQDSRLYFRLVLTGGSPAPGRAGGRFDEHWLTDNVADAPQRTLYGCGPAGFLDALMRWHDARGEAPLVHERFQAPERPHGAGGKGGTVRFLRSAAVTVAAGEVSLLAVAEEAGLTPQQGCRMGICHTCKCPVKQGRVRDLRSGESREVRDEAIRICIHAADGDVDLEL